MGGEGGSYKVGSTRWWEMGGKGQNFATFHKGCKPPRKMLQGHEAGTSPFVCTSQDVCCRDIMQAGAHKGD